MTFHISQQVRLIEAERLRQHEIGDAPGRVHGVNDGVVEVLWLASPMFRAWHKADDLEPAP